MRLTVGDDGPGAAATCPASWSKVSSMCRICSAVLVSRARAGSANGPPCQVRRAHRAPLPGRRAWAIRSGAAVPGRCRRGSVQFCQHVHELPALACRKSSPNRPLAPRTNGNTATAYLAARGRTVSPSNCRDGATTNRSPAWCRSAKAVSVAARRPALTAARLGPSRALSSRSSTVTNQRHPGRRAPPSDSFPAPTGAYRRATASRCQPSARASPGRPPRPRPAWPSQGVTLDDRGARKPRFSRPCEPTRPDGLSRRGRRSPACRRRTPCRSGCTCPAPVRLPAGCSGAWPWFLP